MVNALCIPIRKIKNCGNKKADNLEIFFFFFPIKDARVILYHIANVTFQFFFHVSIIIIGIVLLFFNFFYFFGHIFFSKLGLLFVAVLEQFHMPAFFFFFLFCFFFFSHFFFFFFFGVLFLLYGNRSFSTLHIQFFFFF